MPGIILSADIGTSSLKAAFIHPDGRLSAFARAVYRPDANGVVDAAAWERAFAQALEKLAAQAPGCVPDAVCISGNGPTLVPVTAGGEALPPLYWHGGKTMPPPGADARSFFLPYAAWFKDNRNGDYKRTTLFVSSHEWLAFRLGAEALTVLPSAAYEPYYWNAGQCRLYGVDPGKFPPFVKMGEIMGRVKAASPYSGAFSGRGLQSCLKSGTPIIAGGPDFITALIGTGTLKPGDVCDRAGSSEGINMCVAEPPETEHPPASGIRVLPHAKEGLWNTGVVIPSSGRLFDWYRAFTGRESIGYEEQLSGLIPSSGPSPGNGPFRPDFSAWQGDFFFTPASPDGGSGSPAEAAARGGFYPGASGEDAASLGRAVLCAIGFSVRSAIEKLPASGFPVKELRVSGGQGKSPSWNQLKADITGVPLMVPEIPDGELAGNAVLAAAALEKRGMEEIAGRMIRFRGFYRPGPGSAGFWEARYRLYKEAAERDRAARSGRDGT